MARPHKMTKAERRVTTYLEEKHAEYLKQAALIDRRSAANLASKIVADWVEAQMVVRPLNNGHEYKQPKVRATQTA